MWTHSVTSQNNWSLNSPQETISGGFQSLELCSRVYFINRLPSPRDASFCVSVQLPWAFWVPLQGVSPTPLGQSQPWKALLLGCWLAREETACWPELIRDDYSFTSIQNLMLIVDTIFPPLNESPALLKIDIWKCTLANMSIIVKTIRSKALFLIPGFTNLSMCWSPLRSRFSVFV